jgi:hypothetical protein
VQRVLAVGDVAVAVGGVVAHQPEELLGQGARDLGWTGEVDLVVVGERVAVVEQLVAVDELRLGSGSSEMGSVNAS